MPQRILKMHAEIAAEATKTAPPAAVAAVEAVVRDGGIGPVGWATIAYIALQAAYLLWKWRRDRRREQLGLPPIGGSDE